MSPLRKYSLAQSVFQVVFPLPSVHLATSPDKLACAMVESVLELPLIADTTVSLGKSIDSLPMVQVLAEVSLVVTGVQPVELSVAMVLVLGVTASVDQVATVVEVVLPVDSSVLLETA